VCHLSLSILETKTLLGVGEKEGESGVWGKKEESMHLGRKNRVFDLSESRSRTDQHTKGGKQTIQGKVVICGICHSPGIGVLEDVSRG